jgi:predicted outer membrane repeat protein
MNRLTLLGGAVCLLWLLPSVSATVLHVPGEYPTIQQGITAAVNGDTVLVADGTYTGYGNRDIDFYGKAIVVMSENGADATMIDCEGSSWDYHRGFYFHSGETSSAVVQGFTITSGTAVEFGGGIFCNGSSPTIRGNIITGNETVDGAGIHCRYGSDAIIEGNTIACNTAYRNGGGLACYLSSPTVARNTISQNEVTGPVNGRGGGIYLSLSSPAIVGNLIAGNTSYDGGGGILSWNWSSPLIEGNTFSGNVAGNGGGAIYCDHDAHPTVRNCILWGDTAEPGPEIYLGTYYGHVSYISVAFSDVAGGSSAVYVTPGCALYWGEGNVDADPLFVSGPQGDYYLSQVAAGQPDQSPCVDAGHPDSPVVEGTTRTDEVCDVWPVDMGYHYYPCESGPVPPLVVQVTPDTTQVVRGEDLWFAVDVVNVTDSTLIFDAWVDAYYYNGNPYAGNPVLGPVELALGGGFGLYGVRRHVHIPLCAPYGGPYALYVRTGNHPDSVWAEDYFEFAIVPPPAE